MYMLSQKTEIKTQDVGKTSVKLQLHITAPGSENCSEIEIETALIVFGNAIGNIKRTDEGIKPYKKAAGSNQIVEFNIIDIRPGIAHFKRSAQISGQEVEIPYTSHVDQLQQTELLAG